MTTEALIESLVETWQTHHRVNLYLLDNLPQGGLGAAAASKGRSVGEAFAHLHNVRLMWLQSAAPELLAGLGKFEKDVPLSTQTLREGLEASAAAIAELLRLGFRTGRVKGFKPHPAAFLGYLISHESHHRGQIALALKQSGLPLDKKTAFGLWEWGVR